MAKPCPIDQRHGRRRWCQRRQHHGHPSERQIDAGGTASLIAKKGAIELLASADTTEQHNSSKSSSGSVGASIGAGGVSANASASQASSNGQGTSTTYNNTHINAGQGVTLESGGDATLKGAIINPRRSAATLEATSTSRACRTQPFTTKQVRAAASA